MQIGSVVVVYLWQKRRFVGVCIGIRKKGLGSSFTIRSKGTEYTFPFYSPHLLAIQVKGLAR